MAIHKKRGAVTYCHLPLESVKSFQHLWRGVTCMKCRAYRKSAGAYNKSDRDYQRIKREERKKEAFKESIREALKRLGKSSSEKAIDAVVNKMGDKL